MAREPTSFDRPLFACVIALVFIGFLIFSSASLGLLARDGATFSSVAVGQILIGIIGGGIALILATRIHYRKYRRFALWLFLASLLGTLLVFVPGIGFTYGGATRWIDLGITTFQPAELLKLGFVIVLAHWLSKHRSAVRDARYGFLPVAGLIALCGATLLLQPDTGTFLVILITGIAMFIAAGARIRDLLGFSLLAGFGLYLISLFRPYVVDRLITFLDPGIDPTGISYQIQQSLIAVGSGNIFGRGFGQSIQKFDYLPEPIGDSIFAVFAEEFGFAGAFVLIALFLFFALRSLRIASNAPDQFGGLLVVGIAILIISQSFINIGSLIGVFPLTGLPLLFISHGGTALFFALIEVGIILNVSRYSRRRVTKI